MLLKTSAQQACTDAVAACLTNCPTVTWSWICKTLTPRSGPCSQGCLFTMVAAMLTRSSGAVQSCTHIVTLHLTSNVPTDVSLLISLYDVEINNRDAFLWGKNGFSLPATSVRSKRMRCTL